MGAVCADIYTWCAADLHSILCAVKFIRERGAVEPCRVLGRRPARERLRGRARGL